MNASPPKHRKPPIKKAYSPDRKRVIFNVRLLPHTIEQIKAEAKARDMSQTEIIEAAFYAAYPQNPHTSADN